MGWLKISRLHALPLVFSYSGWFGLPCPVYSVPTFGYEIGTIRAFDFNGTMELRYGRLLPDTALIPPSNDAKIQIMKPSDGILSCILVLTVAIPTGNFNSWKLVGFLDAGNGDTVDGMEYQNYPLQMLFRATIGDSSS